MLPSVSIATPTRIQRLEFLELNAYCIHKQDYKNIKEWVIVDSSDNLTDAIPNFLKNIREKYENFPEIKYIIPNKQCNRKIGAYRNLYNQYVSGDIIVCFDDDEYYYPTRVSHAVEMLEKKKCMIVGLSPVTIYDSDRDDIWRYNVLTNIHGSNNTMAYRKEYLLNHHYDETVENAEEASFTNNFSVHMEQLDSDKVLFQTAHGINTYNKRRIFIQNTYLKEKSYVRKMDMDISDFIKDKYALKLYKKILKIGEPYSKSKYDIAYYCGMSQEWNPESKKLGGSEKAVVNLAREWVKKGKTVVVYADIKENKMIDGVDYKVFGEFYVKKHYKTLILWRLYGYYPILDYKIKADNVFIDFHDTMMHEYDFIERNIDKIDKFFFKSKYHATIHNRIPDEKKIYISNGIEIENFKKKDDMLYRNPFRMCYTSCYTRGIIDLLKHCFPLIYKIEPRAELHIYYGMDAIKDDNMKRELRDLFKQPGVMEHGRQSIDIIAREKYMSSIHLYYTNTPLETDCIAVRESLVSGCIPILSIYNVFGERHGIHFKGDPNDTNSYKELAGVIIQLMKEPREKLDIIREQLRQSSTIKSWENVATEWLKYIDTNIVIVV